jgi:hypothetical protein
MKVTTNTTFSLLHHFRRIMRTQTFFLISDRSTTLGGIVNNANDRLFHDAGFEVLTVLMVRRIILRNMTSWKQARGYCLLLAWIILYSWRWRKYIPPNHLWIPTETTCIWHHIPEDSNLPLFHHGFFARNEYTELIIWWEYPVMSVCFIYGFWSIWYCDSSEKAKAILKRQKKYMDESSEETLMWLVRFSICK